MAATIKGFSAGEIKPQPGFSARQSEQGGWVGNHEFAIKASDFDIAQSEFAKGTLLADLDPDIPDPFSSFLRISEVELSRVEGDLMFFRVVATGSGVNQFEEGDLGAGAEPTYTLTGQLTDVPFSNHRKWQALSDTENTLQDFYQKVVGLDLRNSPRLLFLLVMVLLPQREFLKKMLLNLKKVNILQLNGVRV